MSFVSGMNTPNSANRVRFKHLFAEPQPGETLREFMWREEKAYQLRRDELRLAMEEGCGIDVDIEARLKARWRHEQAIDKR